MKKNKVLGEDDMTEKQGLRRARLHMRKVLLMTKRRLYIGRASGIEAESLNGQITGLELAILIISDVLEGLK